jgi:hypothetical protein
VKLSDIRNNSCIKLNPWGGEINTLLSFSPSLVDWRGKWAGVYDGSLRGLKSIIKAIRFFFIFLIALLEHNENI